MSYSPDRWVIVKIKRDGLSDIFKVFATWFGGFAYGDEWRLNSGITSVKADGDSFVFAGASGSEYTCHKYSYGTSVYSQLVLHGLMAKAIEAGATMELMPKDTDWLSLKGLE